MREIKFRAWHQQRKDFIHVATIDFVNNECYGLAYDIQESDEMLTCGLDNLEQFTGVTDKNGKDIYEGDIIVLGANKPCVVTYDEQRACFSADLIGRGNTCFHTDFWSKGEVVGNIHENKDLLN